MFLVRSAKSSAEPNLHVIHILFTSFLGEIYMLFIVTVFGNSSEICLHDMLVCYSCKSC